MVAPSVPAGGYPRMRDPAGAAELLHSEPKGGAPEFMSHAAFVQWKKRGVPTAQHPAQSHTFGMATKRDVESAATAFGVAPWQPEPRRAPASREVNPVTWHDAPACDNPHKVWDPRNPMRRQEAPTPRADASPRAPPSLRRLWRCFAIG